MNTKLQKNAKGFTIIEVLIVLAIAGLILLIVFLAVPALQRNSRNTQRKNDVSTLLGGFSEYASNNNGSQPTAWAGGQLTGAGTPAGANMGYFTAATIAAGANGALTTDVVRVQTGAICGGGGAAVIAGASARSIAVQYMIEGAGGLVATCQNS